MMPRSRIRQPRTPLSFKAQRRVWLTVAVLLTLITACQSQATTPGAATIPVSREPTRPIATAPAATIVLETAQPSASPSTEAANRPARETLEQHALAVEIYQPGDPAACGLPLVAAPADTSANVRVFFGCTPTTGPVLSAVPARQVAVPPGSDPKAAALRALLTGPTDDEQQAGYLSNFGAASQNVDATIEMLDDGLVVVDFDPAIRKVPFIFVSNIDATQIVATLGQFPDVKRVTILIGGKLLCQITEAC